MSESKRPFPIDELLRAVELEVVTARRSEPRDGVKVSLSAGRVVSSAAERYEYLFTCKKWHRSLDTAAVLVRPSTSRGSWMPAEAARLPDGTVRLVTAESLGTVPLNVQLREDDSTGFTRAIERLESAADDDALHLETAGWVVGRGEPRSGIDDNPSRWVANWPALKLNSRQRIAVQRSLASEVLFLWGPPGTGKTDVVGHVVEGNFRQGRTVLFLAPTKVAVDQALERICDLLNNEAGFSDGLIQRAGDIEVGTLRARYGSSIDPEQVIDRVTVELDEAIAQSTEAWTRAQTQLRLYDDAGSLLERLHNARSAKKDAELERIRAGQDYRKADADAQKFQEKLIRVTPPRGMFADRKEGRIAALRRDLADAEGQRQRAAQQRQAAEDAIAQSAGEIDKAEHELAAVTSILENIEPHPTLVDRAEGLRKQLDELNQQRAKIRQAVRGRCRIMGTTIAKAIQSRRLLDRIDVVVIDEAGMVDLPSAWLAAALARERVVIAGDFRQLPAVTKADSDRKASDDDRAHARMWSSRDPFRASGLVTESGTVRDDPRLVALDTQYRMREPICDLVNAVAYPDAPLRTGRNNTSRIPANPLVETPMILIDTSRQRIPNRQNQSNTVHEAVIHELIRGLQYEGVLPGRKWQESEVAHGSRPTDRLAVITPYRKQVKALQSSVKYRFGTDYDALVDTIHRFQGSQRPIVIFDTAAGAGSDPGYFYTGSGLSSQTCRLLNVALSRAQDHLIVVADVDHLRQHLPAHSEARVMIEHLENHAQVLSADQLVPIREAAQLSELSEEELRRPAFFPADEVEKAVEWDIARAVTSVELYCPFLDPVPVNKWSKRLGERAGAGVRVVVYTRSVEEQRDPPAAERHRARIEQLRSAGCAVDFRERMHEKVLIIDREILWHGSLNLLANSGPTDLMMRFTDPGACERVGTVIERARKDRAARNFTAPSNSDFGQQTLRTPVTSGGAGPDEREVVPGTVVNGRLYLAVGYDEKDEAKRLLRARWDRTNKLWYVDSERVTREQARRWLPQS
ncbi:ATP-dependent RecD-like DNA helicase [Nocardia cerradoensis]|uniref:ATP-dependent RecD-like DNA helicase n=1 Tax=Nocardia cerradoensis TaxID=85688 RepID=A0A231GTL3_9NOCA|nr:AAA domain-containing protein [Nocardia cerradoensis]NKY44306.1 AAA family ATPase [Nocardia cerradoensis]OXR39956.1 ATP-dependent RecD-like DNA helicase [Nocardia cerradoensis]